MKLASIIFATALLSAGSLGAASPEFRFSGEVKAGQLPADAFGLVVKAGYVEVLDLPSGLKLEVSAPRQDGENAKTQVRLLQANGKQYRILHEAVTTGSSANDRLFSYLVCGSQVTFYSPAPANIPVCK
ncbi:MAG: hypothetical protein ACRCV9_18785 [Burkholderiaceae bacterium]